MNRILALLTVLFISAFLTNDLVGNLFDRKGKTYDCDTNATNLDLHGIFFLKSQGSASYSRGYDLIDVFACNWNRASFMSKGIEGFFYDSTEYSFDSLNYKILHHVPESGVNEYDHGYVIEISDPTDSLALGVIFGSPTPTGYKTLSQGYMDSTNAVTDTLTSLGIQTSNPPQGVYPILRSYLITFDTTGNYANEYHASELKTTVFFNTNHNRLKVIKDKDRNDKIIGLTFKSAKNNQEYTKIFEPNN